MARRLTVKTPSVETPVQRLSGGNQQKVVVGKWLGRADLKVLILDEPSRGVDVGARAQIHAMIRDLARDGLSVIVVSSEAEELPGLCDRILVMAEGRVVEELTGPAITRQAIIQASYHQTGEARGRA
jgi:ABC-type sugar transport system ATPase subunit